MIVSNPVDVLTYAAWKISGYPAHRVIGSGTVLDTPVLNTFSDATWMWTAAAFTRSLLAEHGDSELAVWSSANVSGIELNHFCEIRGHFKHGESMQRILRGCARQRL